MQSLIGRDHISNQMSGVITCRYRNTAIGNQQSAIGSGAPLLIGTALISNRLWSAIRMASGSPRRCLNSKTLRRNKGVSVVGPRPECVFIYVLAFPEAQSHSIHEVVGAALDVCYTHRVDPYLSLEVLIAVWRKDAECRLVVFHEALNFVYSERSSG